MPEGEGQAYRLFLPLHCCMQHGLCQCGVGPVLIAGDGEMAGGLLLCNGLVNCSSRHVQHISDLHRRQSSLDGVRKRGEQGGGGGGGKGSLDIKG